MRAVRIHQYGGPDAMQVEELPDPRPADGQALIDVEASGVNFIDIYHRSGLYKVPLPFTLGQEGAGTVAALGHQVLGCGRSAGAVEELARGLGEPHDFQAVDVVDEAAVRAWTQRLLAQYGPPGWTRSTSRTPPRSRYTSKSALFRMPHPSVLAPRVSRYPSEDER